MTAGRRLACAMAIAVVTLASAACVDKAPPPMWPAPPPPAVAEVIGAPAQVKAPPMPVGVVGAGALSGPPSPLDSVPVDKANMLDPEGPAATHAAKTNQPPPPRPVPTHR